ncbi:MAG: hypothetical protein O3B00_03480 [archaeon]|jgi:metal-responsive CopG/Arc/MetJ family transcriptional regulator|nr:hypothetical protein [archaeon]MDA1130543.1 hypothetical protein [archaeon]
MSRVLSFSTDSEFATLLDFLIEQSGYSNRSMFLRDASLHFAEATRRGDLSVMDDNIEVEGTIVIYYQHGVEHKLIELRHSHSITVSSYNHNCLTESHTCVDTMQIKGEAKAIREAVEKLKNTNDVDRVVFVVAPMREDGCC